ncbi:hypothetical protein R3P38DRAFT_911205 [Favolaschia claudopus]|uniref:Uncharacterized protein n=1 Tax=Favolaschia claudopus TaxID=2862362 RepID=A0AAW0BQU6_9AGAR
MGLSSSTVDLILSRVQTKPGYRTHVEFKTLASGSFRIEARLGPLKPEAQVLPNPVLFPSVPLSSLQRTHQLACTTHIFLVKISSGDLSNTVRVFKASCADSSLVAEVEFMSHLPHSDFVLRPTHIVTDEVGVFHGLLSDYHPASSLCRSWTRFTSRWKNPCWHHLEAMEVSVPLQRQSLSRCPGLYSSLQK